MTVRQLASDPADPALAIRPARARRVSTVEAVVDELKDAILSGRIPPGTVLPSEAELCRVLGVSRTTIREAAQVLEQLGLVARSTNPGRRLVVPFDAQRAARVPLTDLLEYDLISFDEVIELLTVIEPWAASCAAERANETERDILRTTMAQFAATSDLELARGLHFQLHDQIAVASHNRFLLLTVNSIEVALRPMREQVVSDAPSLAYVVGLHQPLVDAIVAGDPVAADASARNHVRTFDRIYQAYRAARAVQTGEPGGPRRESRIRTRIPDRTS